MLRQECGELAKVSEVSTALLTSKTYSITEAAHLARTSGSNIRHWLYGQDYPGHSMKPVFDPDRDTSARLSFVDLAEVIVVATYRRKGGKGIPIDRFRRARSFAKIRFGVDHLYATEEFSIEGGHIMHEFELEHPGPGKLALDLDGVWALPFQVQDVLQMFEFQTGGLASKWFPRGKEIPIVLDPRLGAGRPVIAGSNVRLEVLVARWKAKWTIEEIAEDFEIDTATVRLLSKKLREAVFRRR